MEPSGSIDGLAVAAEASVEDHYLHVALRSLVAKAENEGSVTSHLAELQQKKRQLMAEKRDLKREEKNLKRQKTRLQKNAANQLTSKELIEVLVIQSNRESTSYSSTAGSTGVGQPDETGPAEGVAAEAQTTPQES